jgi:hypothetical protein
MTNGLIAIQRTGRLWVALVLVIVGTCDVGNARQDVEISFKMLEPTVTLHEPVRVEFSVYNGLPEQIQFDLGFNRKGSFDFFITAPGENKVHLHRLSEEGPGRIGRLSLATGQTYTQVILLNEWYRFVRPGEYEIEARLIRLLQTQTGIAIESNRTNQMHLRILAANPERLKLVCQALAKVAIEAPTFLEASEAALALSFMEDPSVVPCLEDVLHKSRMVKAQAAVGLGRIANREAIEILISSLNSGDPELISVVRAVLKDASRKTENKEIRDKIDIALDGQSKAEL